MATNDPADDATASDSAGRLTLDRVQTYDRVKALLAESGGDLTTRQAFERVAAERGRSVGTVQAAYYRMARSDPDTAVKRRPRGAAKPAPPKAATRRAGSRRGSAAVSPEGARLIENFLDAQQALLDYVKALEADRRRLESVRGALGT